MNILIFFLFLFIAAALLILAFSVKNFVPAFAAGGIFIIIGVVILVQGIPEITGTSTNTTTTENNETIAIEENVYTYEKDVYTNGLGSILVVIGMLSFLTIFLMFGEWRNLDGN